MKNNKKIIDMLNIRCNTLLQEAINKNNKDDTNLYTTIKDILSHDKIFSGMDIITSMNILIDLGFDKEKAKKLVLQLISQEM